MDLVPTHASKVNSSQHAFLKTRRKMAAEPMKMAAKHKYKWRARRRCHNIAPAFDILNTNNLRLFLVRYSGRLKKERNMLIKKKSIVVSQLVWVIWVVWPFDDDKYFLTDKFNHNCSKSAIFIDFYPEIHLNNLLKWFRSFRNWVLRKSRNTTTRTAPGWSSTTMCTMWPSSSMR